jgi:hypothetical protein
MNGVHAILEGHKGWKSVACHCHLQVTQLGTYIYVKFPTSKGWELEMTPPQMSQNINEMQRKNMDT